MNRRLIRSSLSRIKENSSRRSKNTKQDPPELTNAESFYYLKQMQNKTSMVLILTDGEKIRGNIEWYDRNSIKISRHLESNLLIFKHSIRYMYKEDEETSTDK